MYLHSYDHIKAKKSSVRLASSCKEGLQMFHIAFPLINMGEVRGIV